MTTDTAPVPAKLDISIPKTKSRSSTYKNPALGPQLAPSLASMSGVQKLNMIPNKLENAKAHPAVRARSRCCGISTAYAYPIAEAAVVLNVAKHAKKIYDYETGR